ncbi:hypothetical protein WA026_020612 [Henosepilachna vigintioctopunctata]|uniref:Uncharacterized protein n=1 Tax=Henosepilachna vigintioctopunctata TaxID=420089 RepID=A0AAW1V4W3_9CUCU
MTISEGFFLTTLYTTSIVIVGLVQGVLVKSFSLVIHFEDINSLQQLIEYNFRIINSFDIFHDDSSEIMKKLNERIENIYSDVSQLSVILKSKDLAYFERERDAKYYIEANFTNDEGRPLLHVVEECPISYFITYIVPLGSPYIKRINELIMEFSEAGLIEYWYSSMVENLIKGKTIHEHRVHFEKRRPFSMKDVEFSFFILYAGLTLSIIVFSLELSARYLKEKFLKITEQISIIW